MGHWRTLHLFDDKKFYSEIVPQLKGDVDGLENSYLEFIRTHLLGGMSHLTKEEINKLIDRHLKSLFSIANTIVKDFKRHLVFDSISAYQDKIDFMNQLSGHYDFCNFLAYYIFETCADFFPYVPLGKGGVLRNFNINLKALSYSVLGELDGYNDFLCGPDRMGVTNWISYEDVELLFLDKSNLHFNNNNNELATSFLTLLDIAQKNKLGFIMGQDMRENILEQLPKNKLISNSDWMNLANNGLLFER